MCTKFISSCELFSGNFIFTGLVNMFIHMCNMTVALHHFYNLKRDNVTLREEITQSHHNRKLNPQVLKLNTLMNVAAVALLGSITVCVAYVG